MAVCRVLRNRLTRAIHGARAARRLRHSRWLSCQRSRVRPCGSPRNDDKTSRPGVTNLKVVFVCHSGAGAASSRRNPESVYLHCPGTDRLDQEIIATIILERPRARTCRLHAGHQTIRHTLHWRHVGSGQAHLATSQQCNGWFYQAVRGTSPGAFRTISLDDRSHRAREGAEEVAASVENRLGRGSESGLARSVARDQSVRVGEYGWRPIPGSTLRVAPE